MDLMLTKGITEMSTDTQDKIKGLTEQLRELPQLGFKTTHILHAGMYSRICTFPAGTVLTGVLIKIPTVLTIVGDVAIYTEQGTQYYYGANVLPCSKNRMACMVTLTETFMQMSFASNAKTVEEAEKEFTDQYQELASHGLDNEIIITEDQ